MIKIKNVFNIRKSSIVFNDLNKVIRILIHSFHKIENQSLKFFNIFLAYELISLEV